MSIALESIRLTRGKHDTRDAGMCAMEAVAWLAGESHSDHPLCVCPARAEAMRVLNDACWKNDFQRTQALLPLLPRLLGTAERHDESRVGIILTLHAVQKSAPMALEFAGLTAEAEHLRKLTVVSAASEKKEVLKRADEYLTSIYWNTLHVVMSVTHLRDARMVLSQTDTALVLDGPGAAWAAAKAAHWMAVASESQEILFSFRDALAATLSEST